MKPWLKFVLLVLILISGILVVHFTGLKRYTDPKEVAGLVEQASQVWWALPVFIGIYAGLTLLAFPGSILTLSSGALFGVVVGIIAANIGATIGAAAAFGVGRFLGREWVEQKFGGGKFFEKFQTSMREQGFFRVLQLRLIPLVPFNLMNFGCGVTRVGFVPYLLATMIGTLPGTSIYVYVGYSTSRLWIQGSQADGQKDVLLIHVVVSIALLLLVTLVPLLVKKFRKPAPSTEVKS